MPHHVRPFCTQERINREFKLLLNCLIMRKLKPIMPKIVIVVEPVKYCDQTSERCEVKKIHD